MTHEQVTTWLDTLAMLAVAVGTAGGCWAYIGWWAVAVGGLLLALMSLFAAGVHAAQTERAARVEAGRR